MIFMGSYRTSMQIVGDLLTATEQSGQEGIKTTALISKANLSHSRLSELISNVTKTSKKIPVLCSDDTCC